MVKPIWDASILGVSSQNGKYRTLRIWGCQVGVFLAYTTTQGSILVDRALYLPQEWLHNQARCQSAGIPKETVFQTKPQLALTMIENALTQGLPVDWVTGDAV